MHSSRLGSDRPSRGAAGSQIGRPRGDTAIATMTCSPPTRPSVRLPARMGGMQPTTRVPAPRSPHPLPPWPPNARSPARDLWAVLPSGEQAPRFEPLPLTCPNCGADRRIVAFIAEAAPVERLLTRIGAPSRPPPIAPTRGPPGWDDAPEPLPDWEVFAQRVAWSPSSLRCGRRCRPPRLPAARCLADPRPSNQPGHKERPRRHRRPPAPPRRVDGPSRPRWRPGSGQPRRSGRVGFPIRRTKP